jgi:hypothetical protein
MAKFELRLFDACDNDRFVTCELYNGKNDQQIFLKLEDIYTKDSLSIFLDKSTSIKLAKILRTEINKIKETEGEDGNR